MLSQVQSPLSASEPLLLRRVITRNSRKRKSDESLSSISISSGSGPGFPFGNEISTQDFVFSIAHVFEQILSSLDRKSLFRCRLVSHKWRVVSTELIKRNNSYYLTFECIPKHRTYVQRGSRSQIYLPKFTLRKLTSFLKTTYSGGDSDGDARSSLSMESFPTNKILILSGKLDIPQFQSFLNIFGKHIRNLYLEFSIYPRPLDESVLMKSIETLLSVQAPNLVNLTLWARLQRHNTEGDEDCDLGPLLGSDQKSDPAESKGINLRKNSKLKKLTFGVGSKKILEKIISISPHLQDIRLDSARFHFLMKPVNRLHLLRQFNINANGDRSFNFENIKMIEGALSLISQKERQTQNLPPIKFTTLCVSFSGIAKSISESEGRRLCFVRVINKVLELSWDTLKYISLQNHTGGTLRGIKWPAELPKVRELVLCPTLLTSGLDVFPSHGNFKIQDTFPKLNKLYFDLTATYSGSFSAVQDLQKRNFGPVPRVTFVHVNMFVTQIPHSLNLTTDALLVKEFHFMRNVVQNVFPNAKTILDIVSSY